MTDTEQEKSPEQEEREQLVKDQEQEALDDGRFKANPFNDNESAHQRWLETGQTEPAFMMPPEDEDEDTGDEDADE